MDNNIIIKKTPKIEFQLLNDGFQLIDEQTEQNSGFYSYNDLKSVELHKTWYPRVAKWLRVITWMLNGVPFFPDSESCKQANIKIHFSKIKIGLWLTDSTMIDKAKMLKGALDEKVEHLSV